MEPPQSPQPAPTAGPPVRAAVRLRRSAVALGLLGLLAATVAVVWSGAPQVWRALAAVGLPGFLLLCAFSLAVELVLGGAWALLYPGGGLRRLPLFLRARLVRDAAVQALPFTHLAGPVAGGRVLVLGGLSPTEAAAVALLDTVLEFLAGLVFMLAGAGVAAWRLAGRIAGLPAGELLAAAAAVAAVGAVLLLAAPDLALRLLERAAARFRPAAMAGVERLRDAFAGLRGRRAAVAGCLLLHLTTWLLGAAWVALALRLIGLPIPVLAAVALEAAICAARGAGFVIPNALGVQEGAYALLAPLFGLPPEAGVAISLLKRGRDLALGVPILLLWQGAETARLRAQTKTAAPQGRRPSQ